MIHRIPPSPSITDKASAPYFLSVQAPRPPYPTVKGPGPG